MYYETSVFFVTSFNRQTWNCILYCPGPGIPFSFNTLSFLALHIPSISIENVFVSSGLNLLFSKGITGTALGLGWYKGFSKESNRFRKWI